MIRFFPRRGLVGYGQCANGGRIHKPFSADDLGADLAAGGALPQIFVAPADHGGGLAQSDIALRRLHRREEPIEPLMDRGKIGLLLGDGRGQRLDRRRMLSIPLLEQLRERRDDVGERHVGGGDFFATFWRIIPHVS
jgi:hypothetical protein